MLKQISNYVKNVPYICSVFRDKKNGNWYYSSTFFNVKKLL